MIFIKAEDVKELLKDSVVREVVTNEEFQQFALNAITSAAKGFGQGVGEGLANNLNKR